MDASLPGSVSDAIHNNIGCGATRITAVTVSRHCTGDSITATVVQDDTRQVHLFIKYVNKNDSGYLPECEVYFHNEVTFYNEVVMYFQKLGREVHGCIGCVPRMFYAQDVGPEAFVILENILSAGFKPIDINQTLTPTNARSVLKELARLHSYSFVLRERDPNVFQELKGKLKDTTKISTSYEKLFVNGIHDALKLARQAFPRDSVYVKKLSYFALNVFERVSQLARGDEEDHPYEVISHGDLWPGNILCITDKDDLFDTVRFVDFQGCRCCSPAQDLILLLLVGMDRATRDEYWDELLTWYYEELCANLRSFGCDSNEVFPYDSFNSQIFKHARYSMGISLVGLPMFLNEISSQTSEEDQEDLVQFVKNLNTRKSLKCKNKILEVVMDVIDRGFLDEC